jgi:hypothetical protein
MYRFTHETSLGFLGREIKLEITTKDQQSVCQLNLTGQGGDLGLGNT